MFCSACGVSISEHAKFCPACGAVAQAVGGPAVPPPLPLTSTPKHPKQRVAKGCGIGCLVLIVLAFAAAVASKGGKGGSATSGWSNGKADAWIMAQKFVKDRLRSPGTASFGGLFTDHQDSQSVVEDLGNGHFRVDAWVDSQNAFGGVVRSYFTCELEMVGDDRWQATRVDIRER